MLRKIDWYNLLSKVFGWKKNRESQREYLFTGFFIGMLIATVATLNIVVLSAKVSLLSMVGLTGILTLFALMIGALLTIQFGYKDLKSVVKNSFFKWGLLVGISFMIISIGAVVIALIGFFNNPATIQTH